MKKIWNNLGSLLMDKAGDGGSGGGAAAGSGSFFTPPAGGGQVPPDKGNAGASSGAAGDKPPVDAGAGNAPQGTGASDWRSSLPKELQEDATIKKFSDVSTLAKSYLNAQKLIGADKIPVPTKHTTDEEWNNIYKRLGLPEKPEDYAVKFKEGVSVDDKFSKDFKDTAYKLGVLPKQAQALADWFSDINLGSEQSVKAEMDKKFQAGVAELKKEWGNSYELQVARANKAANDLGGKELVDYFNSTGLGGDKNIVKFLAKVGESLFGEHKFVDAQGTPDGMSPEQLDKEINKAKMDPAYLDKMHPNHKAAVKEVQELFQKRYPSK